ncbi:hypothetical protein [Puia dinghuensis]|uniref:Uncharacterized protein n=1 Tax=Puia dinghuensis TaxID=1792502 RepID=A0A8J2UIU4_9BACT|nr:hypothetical protein [Puia dinghuensis]GGB23524.1 hypothetical protein GCM10011511_54230 [Puia dinghuensis]
MKRTILLGALALTTICFFSCNQPSTEKTPAPAQALAPTGGTHGGGQPVPWGQIKPCLDAYQAVMAQYGITTDNPRVPITKCPDSTFLITLSESLHADSLVAWLQSQINEYDSAGKGANLNFVIMPGICTRAMLSAVNAPDTNATGRISYFIIARTRTGKTSALTGDPGSGYEVGGIQP